MLSATQSAARARPTGGHEVSLMSSARFSVRCIVYAPPIVPNHRAPPQGRTPNMRSSWPSWAMRTLPADFRVTERSPL